MKLIKEINEYENKSMLNFNQEVQVKFDNFINDMYAFHTRCIDYFKQTKLDDNELKSTSIEVCNGLEQIKKENEQILEKVFNGNVLKFSSAESSSSMIGSLINRDVKPIKTRRLSNIERMRLLRLLHNDKMLRNQDETSYNNVDNSKK